MSDARSVIGGHAAHDAQDMMSLMPITLLAARRDDRPQNAIGIDADARGCRRQYVEQSQHAAREAVFYTDEFIADELFFKADTGSFTKKTRHQRAHRPSPLSPTSADHVAEYKTDAITSSSASHIVDAR